LSKMLSFDKIEKIFSCQKALIEEISVRMTEKDVDDFNSLADGKLKKVAKELMAAAKDFIVGYKTDDKGKIDEAVKNFNAAVKKAGKKTAELILADKTEAPSVTSLATIPPPPHEEISEEELLAAADLMTDKSDFVGEEPIEVTNILDRIFKMPTETFDANSKKNLQCAKCQTQNAADSVYCRNCGEMLDNQNRITAVLGENNKNQLAMFCPNDGCAKFSAFFKPEKDTKFCTTCRTKLLQLVVETVDNTPPPAGIVQKIFSFFGGKK